MFADEENRKLPLFGIPRDGKLKERCCYVNPDFNQVSDAIIWLKREKVISLIVVPVWKNHTWYEFLEKNSTHRFIFPLDAPIFTSQLSGRTLPGKWPCVAFILDTRFAAKATELEKSLSPF